MSEEAKKQEALEMMVNQLWNFIFDGTIHYDEQRGKHYIEVWDGSMRQYLSEEECELFDYV